MLYFSVYGTAEGAAREIARQTCAELRRIEPVAPYDSDRNHYDALSRRAQREVSENLRPAIQNALPIADYDVIFLGYPMWWYAFPMIIRTLFDEYDFTGKTIIPFNTHMGSRDGDTYQEIRHLAPGANVLDGLPIEMGDSEAKVKAMISEWLDRLSVKEYARLAI